MELMKKHALSCWWLHAICLAFIVTLVGICSAKEYTQSWIVPDNSRVC